ncbi:hypothetical protein F183_A46520 [Bryobacterales bacterium F-183]|nr:hypothetical protein F183_A46520 [Bryobacterales bacterium F-183]
MSGLFARLYFDEDVSVRVAATVAARGFDTLTTVQAARRGASDAEQLAFATTEHRVLVTHNRRDFEYLAAEYFTHERRHSGLIIAVRRPPQELSLRLLAVLNQNTSDELVNQTLYI